MQSAHMSSMQSRGKLLTHEHRLRAGELAMAATSLRRAMLDVDLGLAYHGNSPTEWELENIVPSDPSTPIDYESSWELYRYRMNACTLNQTIEQYHAAARSGIAWFMENTRPSVRDNLSATAKLEVEYSLPVVKPPSFQLMSEPEHIPDFLHLHETASFESWIRAEISLEDIGVQNIWTHNQTTHSPVLLFVEDLDLELNFVFSAYTTSRANEIDPSAVKSLTGEDGYGLFRGTTSSAEAAAIKKDKSGDTPRIFLRLADIGYCWPANTYGNEAYYQSVNAFLYPNGPLAFWNAKCKNYRTSLCRTSGGFLFTEYVFDRIVNMPIGKQNALLRPSEHTRPVDFYAAWPIEDSNRIATDFAKFLRPYCRDSLTYRQLRLVFDFFHFVLERRRSNGDLRFSLFGGPPGTGKTKSLSSAIILSKVKQVVRKAFELSSLIDPVAMPPGSIEAAVDVVCNAPIVVATPTNAAANAACRTTEEGLAHLAANKEVLGLHEFSVDPIRVCTFQLAREQKMVRHHPYRAIARILLPAAEQALAPLAHEIRTWKAGRELVMAALRLVTRSQQEGGEGIPFKSPEYLRREKEIEKRYPQFPASKSTTSWGKQYDKRIGYITFLQKLINNPDAFHELSSKTGIPLEFLEEATKHNVLANPNSILFFTAGKMHCYQEQLLETIPDALFVVDEGTMLQTPDLAKIAYYASGIVLAGDINQLKAVVMARVEGTYDVQDSFLGRLASDTAWLDLCWRLIRQRTEFAHLHVYSKIGDGLTAPEGQNIMRGSRLHSRELFSPFIVVDIEDGCQGKESAASKSLINRDEAKAILIWSRLFASEFLRAYPDKKVSLIAMSPYKDQGKLLADEIIPRIQNLPAFDSEACKAGSINVAQGEDVVVGCMSLTKTVFPPKKGLNALEDTPEFLDLNRMNVGSTRAQQHLVVFCNRKTYMAGVDPNSLVYKLLSSAPVLTTTVRNMEAILTASSNTLVPDNVSHLSTVEPCTAEPLQPGQHLWESKGMPFDASDQLLKERQRQLLSERY